MSADGFMRLKTLSGKGKVKVASRHNKRAIQAEHGAAGHIDAARIHLNYSLHGPDTPEAVAQMAKTLMEAAQVKLTRKNAVVAIEIIFSLPPATDIPVDAYFRDCLQWTPGHFGGIENILSADVHLDEAAPHLHVLILPLVGNRMTGSAMAGNRQRLQHLQTDFHGAVAGRYGLKRPTGRLRGAARLKAAQAVMERLRVTNDAVQGSALWSAVRDWIDRDPAAAAHTLGIEIEPPPEKRMRTMAEIMTSTGKGPRKQVEPIGNVQNWRPIGNGHRPTKGPSLCSVGVPASLTPKVAANRLPDAVEGIDDRVIDRTGCDLPNWDDIGQIPPDDWAASA